MCSRENHYSDYSCASRTTENTAMFNFAEKLTLGHQWSPKSTTNIQEESSAKRNLLLDVFACRPELASLSITRTYTSFMCSCSAFFWGMEETKCSSASQESYFSAPLHSRVGLAFGPYGSAFPFPLEHPRQGLDRWNLAETNSLRFGLMAKFH